MMEGTYYKEWSTALGRDMEFKVYGNGGRAGAGVPLPGRPLLRLGEQRHARRGGLADPERPHPAVLRRQHRPGQLPGRGAEPPAPGRNAGEVFLLRHRRAGAPHPGPERRRQGPRTSLPKPKKPGPSCGPVGADLGAYQAVNCRLRRPELFCGAIGLSGRYDVSGWLGGPEDDLALAQTIPLPPLAAGLLDSAAVAALAKGQFLLCAGQGQDFAEPAALASTQALDAALKAAGHPRRRRSLGPRTSPTSGAGGPAPSMCSPTVCSAEEVTCHARHSSPEPGAMILAATPPSTCCPPSGRPVLPAPSWPTPKRWKGSRATPT